jgi:hypothetical protein
MNNGLVLAYAISNPMLIPSAFQEWIMTSGRIYLKTGSIIYAPFIPPIEWEIEHLSIGIALPSYFDAIPCFYQEYEWLSQNNLSALTSLKFPYRENIDFETLSKIKTEN